MTHKTGVMKANIRTTALIKYRQNNEKCSVVQDKRNR